MIYVFYSNDPLGDDQGGGVEHFRGIYRSLTRSNLKFELVASRTNKTSKNEVRIKYISIGSNFVLYYIALWIWFFVKRNSFNEQDVFHFHRNYAAWPKFFFLKGMGTTIITYHGLTGFVLREKIGFLAKPVRHLMMYFESRALDNADRLIFVSDRDRQSMRELLGSNYNKTLVIPATFNSLSFQYSKEPDPSLANKLMMLGRLSVIKNIPLAIEAVCILRRKGLHVELDIYGEGEDRKRIESLLDNYNCNDFIRLRGKISHNQVPTIISEHGIVLVTSTSEASPTVVKEAIASKRPVVTTNVGDVNNWISQGLNGYICEESTSSSVANNIQNAISMICSQNYQQTTDLSKISESSIMNKILSCYQDNLQKKVHM